MSINHFIQIPIRTRLHTHPTIRTSMLTWCLTCGKGTPSCLPSWTAICFGDAAEGAFDVEAASCPGGLAACFAIVFM